MFLSTEEIDTSIRWLLENATPPVRYLTHKHILKTDPRSKQMLDLWGCVENSSDARYIFSKQNEDGSWFSGGPWGPRGYRRQTGSGFTISRPKFVTTAWILPFLGEMGFTVDDERIRKSCEHMLQETGYHYPILGPTLKAVNCCGLEAIPLRAFASVGMASDGRLQGGWDRLSLCQRTDGGWLNPNHLLDSPRRRQLRGDGPGIEAVFGDPSLPSRRYSSQRTPNISARYQQRSSLCFGTYHRKTRNTFRRGFTMGITPSKNC
jgi:hypothetical protein